MAISEEKACIECGSPVTEIRLIDKAHGNAHRDVEYALQESKRGFWLGRFPVEGRVLAFMCEECGRIALYGQPAQTTS